MKSVQLDQWPAGSLQTVWRQRDSVSWLLHQRASPTGRHHQQRPSQASSVGGPTGRWIEHGTDDILVPDRAGDLDRSLIYLYIYWSIYFTTPPACNGWGPWLRLLRGRCSITHQGVPLLGMAGPGPNHRPSRCASCDCQMWGSPREESRSEGRGWRRHNGRRGGREGGAKYSAWTLEPVFSFGSSRLRTVTHAHGGVYSRVMRHRESDFYSSDGPWLDVSVFLSCAYSNLP